MKAALFFHCLFVLGSKKLACASNPDALVMFQVNARSDPLEAMVNEDESCPSKCVNAIENSWFDKCFWEHCQICSACSNEPAVLEGKWCPAECVRATESKWQDKCLWDACKTCNSCAGAFLKEEREEKDNGINMDKDEDCPSSCVDTTGKSWFDKCFWKHCQTCSACSNMPAVVEGKQCAEKCVRATETKWQEKCLWDDCKTCNSCGAAMLRKELAMDEAKTRDACPNECLLTKGKTWVQKCDWKACKVCQNCQSLRSLYDVQGICPHTCTFTTAKTWKEKCGWKTCKACTECKVPQ